MESLNDRNKTEADASSEAIKEFSTLKQIVDELKVSGYMKLVEDPAFKKLENMAEREDYNTDPLVLTQLNEIIEELEGGHFQNIANVLDSNVAFLALKKLAKTPSFNPLT